MPSKTNPTIFYLNFLNGEYGWTPVTATSISPSTYFHLTGFTYPATPVASSKIMPIDFFYIQKAAIPTTSVNNIYMNNAPITSLAFPIQSSLISAKQLIHTARNLAKYGSITFQFCYLSSKGYGLEWTSSPNNYTEVHYLNKQHPDNSAIDIFVNNQQVFTTPLTNPGPGTLFTIYKGAPQSPTT